MSDELQVARLAEALEYAEEDVQGNAEVLVSQAVRQLHVGHALRHLANGAVMSEQMAEVVQRQMQRSRASQYINRQGWTQQQWIEDADRLMNEVDGAITSLVNGHVMHLLDYWRATSGRVDALTVTAEEEK